MEELTRTKKTANDLKDRIFRRKEMRTRAYKSRVGDYYLMLWGVKALLLLHVVWLLVDPIYNLSK